MAVEGLFCFEWRLHPPVCKLVANQILVVTMNHIQASHCQLVVVDLVVLHIARENFLILYRVCQLWAGLDFQSSVLEIQ
jgi:hypothetical protein